MFTFAALLAVTTVVHAQDTSPIRENEPPIRTVVSADPRFAILRDNLLAKVRTGDIPSIAISVSLDGRTIWEEAIGWADRDKRVPATPTMSYALGSLSKSLSAAAVLTLVDRGTLELDAPVARWVRLRTPTGVENTPTLRQLLDASAGIPHGWESVAVDKQPVTDTEWNAWLNRNAFLAFSPGVVFEYSNNSFGVAARVAERAAGKRFSDVIATMLFTPLGMTASHANISATSLDSVAQPYGTSGSLLARTASVPEAGLGMYASVADLARFGRFLRGHPTASGRRPLSPATLAMVWQPSVGPSRDYFHFGLWNGGRTLVTNGNISGANAHLAIGRDDDIVVAVAVNRTGNEADAAAGQIVDLLLPLNPSSRDIRAEYDALFSAPYSPAPAMTGRWTGTVANVSTSRTVDFDVRRDSVFVRFAEGRWIPLERPRMSVFGELRGALSAEIAGMTAPDAGPIRIDCVLKWEGRVLRGYLLPRETHARPLAVQLVRHQ